MSVSLIVEHDGWRVPVVISDELLRPDNREALGMFFATVIDIGAHPEGVGRSAPEDPPFGP